MKLDPDQGAPPRRDHLERWVTEEHDLVLKVRTDILFLDFRTAIQRARLANRGLSLKYLRRPRPGSGKYAFSRLELDQALGCAAGGPG
jgi:hypothetical protein